MKTFLKKKDNKLFFMLIVVVLVIAFFAITHKSELHADYPFYDTIEELYNRADVIVVAKVNKAGKTVNLDINADKTSNEDLEDKKIPYTISEVEVVHIIKGEAEVNQVLQVKQLGDYKNQPESRLKEIDGYLKKDKNVVLFLKGYEDIGMDVPYSILNPDQGILLIENGIIKTVGENPLFTDGLSLNNTIQKLNECNSEKQ